MSMPRTLGILAVLALILGAWLLAVGGATQATGPSQSDPQAGALDPVQLLRSAADVVAFDVAISALEWDHHVVGDVEYDVVTVSGFSSRTMAGSPQVPTRRVLLGVPVVADYRLRITVQESEAGEVVLFKRFTVEVDLSYKSGLESGDGTSDASFEPILSASLLNYESAAACLAADVWDIGLPAFKISVSEDGIYQVTAADLQNLGVPVSAIYASEYKLYYRDMEMSIRVLETGDGKLESLWFYGEQARTKHTDTNVYWLTYCSLRLSSIRQWRTLAQRT